MALLLVSKLAVTAWNCAVFDGSGYDQSRHLHRALRGGFQVRPAFYDAPTYYLPARLFGILRGDSPRGRASEERRSAYLAFLRVNNLVYLTAFYLLWIYGILPRAIDDWRARTLASLLLLSLPGYQKLAMMVHPDNLHVVLASLCTFLCLRLPRVSSDRGWAANLRLALATGLAGLTRPFAISTVLAFAAANVAELTLRLRGSWKRAAFCSLAVLAVTGIIASSWLVWRGIVTGTWRETYPKGYIEKYDRQAFDWPGYLMSFHFSSLLQIPNRHIVQLDRDHVSKHSGTAHNVYANSFFTTLYSETWGDHWLYVSGPVGRDRKVEAKRAVFLAALPLVPLLLLRFSSTLVALARSVRERGLAVALDPRAVLLLHFVSGAALFLVWQFASALTPGKQSSIKFIYCAFLFAPAVALCFATPVTRRRFSVWTVYLVLLFLVALPMATFVPGRS